MMNKYLNKIIEYGLYMLVFLLPVQTRLIIKSGQINNGYLEYGTISLYLTDILLIILLALFASVKISNPKSQIPNPRSQTHWYLIAGLDLMIFISIFAAPDKLLAVSGYLRFLLGLGLFWLIMSANYSRIKLIYGILAGIFLQAGLGIRQFLTQSDFSSKWLGIAMHQAGDLGTSVIETLSGERWLRAYGGLDHPNMLGGLLVIGLLLIVNIVISRNSEFNKNKKNSKPHKTSLFINTQIPNSKFQNKFYILHFAFLIFMASLFFTFSRGAWAGFLAGLIIMFIITMARKNYAKAGRLLKITFIGGLLIFILFSQYQDLVLTRLSKDTRLEIKSNEERIASYEIAGRLIKKHWLMGTGINNYALATQKEIISDRPSWYYQPVHNVFLLIFAEIGVLGFLCFMGLILFTIYFLLTAKAYYRLPILAAMLIMFMVDHWWWSLHFGVLFFWLIMGIILKQASHNNLSRS